ncbi:MAG: GspH/FimT family pseudopilin [Burkholderiales bacterium]|nr:GspH/FimT family pseudopilin [Burkholderiales bacterium]
MTRTPLPRLAQLPRASHRRHLPPGQPGQRGLTLIECCAALAVTALGLSAAVPDLGSARQRHQLQGASAQIESDLHYARSLAVARNAPVRVSFTSGPALTCYVIHTGAADACPCDAQGQPVCRAGAVALRSMPFAADAPVSVRSNSRSMLFDPRNGTVTPTATVQLQGRDGSGVRLVVNVLGRVRGCSTGAALTGYAAC